MNIVETLAPGLSGIDTLRTLIEAGGRPPIGETLEFDLAEVGDGWAAFVGTPSLRAYNPIGMVHGGYAATLLDSACGCAAHSKLTADQAYTTVELKVSYIRAITAGVGPLRAEGRVVSMGRRVVFAEAALKDGNGRLYATATSTLLVIERPKAADVA
ncbi:PaaI family thioesterase [Methylobacterium nonmethylotrophicum]|uniref:PaaI family thioesterase n=1 Tax=Methylobacterium nonmethylotrophicum TaxID=1141884 RepID=A0A4Z0NJQ2_9HYPH|nr:PaaI family thioesterase [Methylobacterium nonmethylotrophicum]TGD96074.1 PaaI family thioesterase [Methylobacterium nonmethylotrophicum]